ncbi:MAG: BMP family ABC transporter substrate-binding protein, partial [Clostridia bacterium]|nr:BMP family ABC transporter substrate-binding protein [Clostridia bacterium]
MKKVLALILCIAMLAAVAVGCGEKAVTNTDGAGDVKIGFIFLHDENSTYDLNFINAAKAATKELGLADDQVIMKVNIPESEACYDAAAELVDEGCTYIFADSFGHEPYMIQAAKEFPEV